jgi:hypothetical protein
VSSTDNSGIVSFKFPLWLNPSVDCSSATTADLELILGKVEEASSYLRKNDVFLSQMPFGDHGERCQRMDLLAQLLRAAMSDPTLLDDAFLELERVKAEEIRLAAMFAVAAGSFFDNPEALAHCAADGQLEQLLDWVRRLKASREAALNVLGKEDCDILRERGFLSRDE